MSEPSTPSFQGMCHYIGQLSKASKAGMRAALADCPKCHFNMLEACCIPSTATARTVPFMSLTLPGRSVSRCRRSRAGCGSWSRTALWCREPDPADRRKTLVRITPKGYELCTSVSRLCATTLPACWHG